MCPSGDRLTSRMGCPYDYFFHLLNLKLKISHGGVTRIFFENNGRSSAYSLRKKEVYKLIINKKKTKYNIIKQPKAHGTRPPRTLS
jgi:hypothetical protein